MLRHAFRFPLFLLLLAASLSGPANLHAQPVLTSAIRGVVVDAGTLAPLPGATVVVAESNPLRGAVTDGQGRFLISALPIGQYRLQVTYMGYAPVMTEALVVVSGKETRTTVQMSETMVTASEVEIRAGYRKSAAINRMATVSARSFSVDETFRFAGSYNDPARMVANFAGVTSGIDNRNDIIVRGNSPSGMQWRIDDMEIPNPNHFAAVGTTGGPVTILNNNLVTNSDFFTGAFPAQYGNTTAGIFDLKMRSGHPERHEYWFGIGWNGLEFGTEGPFTRRHNASYLVAYRYSPLQFLGLFGVDVGFIPKYQDLTLKITVPTAKAGTFTLTGIGGISSIDLFDSRKEQDEWLFPDYGEDLSNGSGLGVTGLSHQYLFKSGVMLKNLLYVVGSGTETKIDTFSSVARTPAPWAGERSTEIRYAWAGSVVKKFSAGDILSAGASWDLFDMSFNDSVMMHGSFLVNTGSRESMQFLRGYLQWHHAFNAKWSADAGLYGCRMTLGHAWAAEPRLGLEWQAGERHTLSFGAGLFSQMQPRVIYYVLSGPAGEDRRQANLGLGFTRSAQAAMGYNFQVSENLRFKTEIYGQYLYDIPVNPIIPPYAVSNQGHGFFIDRRYADSLVSDGSGINLGAEFTFERFFHRNFYYLFTASLFNSTFEGADGMMRNTAFNVNYAMNAAAGYEFVMGRRRWGVMSFGLRATWSGGSPYVPYDQAATVAQAEPVYDWSKAYEPRYPDYRRAALRFGIRRNLPGYNLEFFLDLQYRTSFTNISMQRIDPETGQIRDFFGMSFFPMGTWRIQF